ncbi:MAG: hypothetical protein K2X93_13520 [Candidatus Obscuribacterales bacterium]|nr:hypothetical protein [Candidatus Obscuribacterales bacterium]
MPRLSFDKVYDAHAAASLDKQLQLEHLVQSLGEEKRWEYDLKTGTLKLAGAENGKPLLHEFQIELLGSFANGIGWKWLWANEEFANSPEKLTSSLKLRAFGEEYKCSQLTDSENDDINPEDFAVVGSGLCDALWYFPIEYGGGTAFALCYSESMKNDSEKCAERVYNIFPQAILNLAIRNHRTALRSYLSYYKFTMLEETAGVVRAEHSSGEIKATFRGFSFASISGFDNVTKSELETKTIDQNELPGLFGKPSKDPFLPW